jgi:catechol 2,3-dioxygenase-like lactoylglutathione lyase family enzyme
MITACHTLIYSDHPEATRAFLRDVLQLPHVEADPGWLIFRTGPSELGVHPTHAVHEGAAYDYPRQHRISFMCDDVAATKAELEARGAHFTSKIADEGYGLTAALQVPGAGDVQLYQPRHPVAYDL